MLNDIQSSPSQSSPALVNAESLRGNKSRWTPLWASIPPLLLLGLGVAVGNMAQPSRPGPPIEESPENIAVRTSADGFVAQSETMVVTPRKAAGYSVLRGRLQPVVGAVGKSPLSAQVAQVMVRPGQRVQYGDEILRLSTGVPSRSTRRAELSQKIAEDNQVAAARRQDALQAKIRVAQEQLVETKERVAAAQQRVAAAREIVSRLQRGEVVTTPDTTPDSDTNPPAPERANSAATNKEEARLSAVRRAALRDAEKAQAAADQAEAAALAARRTAEAADKTLEAKKAKAIEAREAAAKVQSLFDAGKAKASAVDAARAELEEAEVAVKEAAVKSIGALKEMHRLEASADEARRQSQKAAAQAAKSLQQLQLFAQSTPSAGSVPEQKPGGTGRQISVTAAVQMARSALAESEATIKKADSIRREIDGYQRQVVSIRQRLAAASSNLDKAQDRVVESNIQQGLSLVRAPASGTVLWVADVADNVAPGEPLVAVGQPGVWEVRLADSSGTWKTLKAGMQLPAVVQESITPNVKPGSTKALAQPAAFTDSRQPSGIPTMARLDEIVSPARPDAPALLKIIIANPRSDKGNKRRFRAGMVVLCSVARPGSRVAISIPSAAILRDADGSTRVAVLTPLELDTPENSDAADMSQLHRIEWREIRPGRGDEVQQEITVGLAAGERIALQPAELQGLTRAHGADATVEVGDMS